MTITLTKEELQEFQGKLSDWYARQFEFVAQRLGGTQHYGLDPLAMNPNVRIAQLLKEFENKNPKPDWRSLL